MTPRQIADIGVARLGLPVPTGKLVTIQALAQALANPQTAYVFEEAVLEWIGTRELESECLEALCALALAQVRPEMISRVRRVIPQPSLASDVLVSLASGNPTVLPSWSGCHAGPAPQLLDLRGEEKALRAGTFIPPAFAHALERLEESSGRPLVRQWAFEFSVLRERVSSSTDGHFEYFLGRQRENVAQFVARQGHLARSSYLRTLACAVERWGMPQHLAVDYALLALPAEPLFLKLAPGDAPPWAGSLHERTYEESDVKEELVRDSLQLAEVAGNRRVMHLSAAIGDAPLCHVELTVFAVVCAEGLPNAKHALGFYDHMLGNLTPARDSLRAFVCPDLGLEGTEELGFVPTVLPLIGANVGYLQTDFVGRIPYVPLASASLPQLEMAPGVGGAQLTSQGVPVGEFACWYWNWQPSHPRGWPSPIGCCSTLTREAADRLEADLGGRIQHVWKLTTWTRQTEYGEWARAKHVGVLSSGPPHH
ncbi:hypothetical protein PE066_08740 [Ramlibacter tataouinensis]|uniref:hypothetical protein n=1 Tax=Ramlibacter tataouinensis TaxID=94132 RepID=UPI0022F3915E|nr:hypothetical protein [Ramlibacter tataouinensis]WBY03601.1 hypothetical protein PE066_08740 [Ramlibacter tataouinensis]